MADERAPAPPLAAVQSALYRVTETLAIELGTPAAEPPAWSELEWRLAPAVASMHGISSLLADTLRWQGPPHWGRFLAEQRQQTLLRQRRIEDLLARIDALARPAGIAAVALKGAALQAAGLYAAGERPMADLDLLVHPADLDGAVAVLLALSYHDAGNSWKHQGFDPPAAQPPAVLGEHADNPIKIDLHHRILERLPNAPVELTDLIYPEQAEPGLNAYPCAAALMAHLLAHAAGNMTHRGVRLIQLCDIARLACRLTAEDWETIVRWHGRERRLWWAAPPLSLAARYLPGTIPADVPARLEHGCPWILRRVVRRRAVADFSYSHLYIGAIPGIIWARSATQAVRYVASRVFPDREQLALREMASRTEPWSSNPGWHRRSQARRILLWLLSRPTRTETLQPVRAALARAD